MAQWLVLVGVLLVALPHRAAYISEIDLGGTESPAGQGIEFSQVDPATDYTLLILDANPFSASAFGKVLDVIHLPAGIGLAGVAMVTDLPWPDNTASTTTLGSLSPQSGSGTLLFNFSKLLILMNGESSVMADDRPLGSDAAAQARYDKAAVLDWLVLSDADPAPLYQSRGHDIGDINTTLGIDLLARIVDTDAGRVVGRTNLPGQQLDMQVFFQGDPDTTRQFAIDEQKVYTYTPSQANLPVTVQVPEPTSLLLMALGTALCLARKRQR
ncbi:MAG: PEP-CTERM sorting domain-containing protein [Planctomycetota bacterium]